jgi:hypothetical protein
MISAGARIATPSGDKPVETLRAGDYVHALEDGAPVARPLRWVGQLQVDISRSPGPLRLAPVRLAAGAISPGLPARDLLLSPDHAILLGRTLFQVQALRNGASIAQEFSFGRITYVHLELARHSIIAAEALPIASYLDTGSRGQFMPEYAARGSLPDLAAAPAAPAMAVWKTSGCAPLRLDSAAVVPAHLVALGRARAIGWALTEDPAVRVLADSVEAPTVRFAPDHWQARLAEGTRAVRLASRSFVPADLDAVIADRRRLGIAVRTLRLAGRTLPSGAFGRGWHVKEPEWRWTDGDARLSLRPLEQAATLEIRTAPGAVPGYWLPPA